MACACSSAARLLICREPHDCEVVAAQFIDSCLSMTFKPMLYNAAGLPTDEQISRVVRTAVRTFLGAYKQAG